MHHRLNLDRFSPRDVAEEIALSAAVTCKRRCFSGGDVVIASRGESRAVDDLAKMGVGQPALN